MSSITEGTITIKDVSHVMDLLVSHLYGSDPHLTVRELVQNAHDALVQLPEEISERDRLIVVRVNALASPGYIEISDTGIGMSLQEITDNLGKIGDSEKLRQAMQKPEIIGRFGIGFLSSFIVANRVQVTTRKLNDRKAWLWETKDKHHWTLSEHPAADLQHGTRVRLFFRNDYPPGLSERIKDLQTVEGVEKIIQTYCYLIPFPIQVGLGSDQARRVNAIKGPWETDSEATVAYKTLFSKNDPLLVYRFEEIDRRTKYHARGALYFHEHYDTSPSVKLYVKRMLVSPEDRLLIPPYGIFVSGLIDCPSLDVDLSRRQIPSFDPAYKWLRKIMLREFEKAFLKMTSSRTDQWLDIWTKADNAFIVPLLRAYHQSNDDVLKEAASSFLLNAGKFLPFYVVDTVSGSQGRASWRTIHEAVDRGRRDSDSAQAGERFDDRKRIKIYFTKSRQPVEKDMLIHKFHEIIDVGREAKAHEELMTTLQRLNDQFPDFMLVEVSASQFNDVDASERARWHIATEHLRRGIVFFGKSHEVVPESFEPKDVPVVITDTNVDPGQLESMRSQLSQVSEQGVGGGIAGQLLGFLNQMAARGGSLTVHLNVSNPLLQKLRDHLDPTNEAAGPEAALDGLSAIAWRAVLDYFGWKSTRDMIARDRIYTHQIISRLLESTTENVALRKKLAERESQVEEIQPQPARAEDRRLAVICGFIDIVGSSQMIVAEPIQATQIIRTLIQKIENEIQKFGGTPVSSSGEGLLFIMEQIGKPVDVKPWLVHLPGLVETACASKAEIREFFQRANLAFPKLRIALHYGDVFWGQVGPSTNLIGLPVIEARSICDENKIYDRGKWDLLMTRQALDKGAAWGMWQAADFVFVEGFPPKGTGRALELFCLRPE